MWGFEKVRVNIYGGGSKIYILFHRQMSKVSSIQPWVFALQSRNEQIQFGRKLFNA